MHGLEMQTNLKFLDMGDYVNYNGNIGVIRKIYMYQTKENVYEVVFHKPSQKLKLTAQEIQVACINE